MSPTDEELLEAWMLGDARAFEQFFTRHQKRVAAYAARKGIPRNEVDEVVQDVFLKLHSHIDQYEVGKKAMPWFFTIVHNTCIDHHRKLGRAKSKLTQVDGFDFEKVAVAPREDESPTDLTEVLKSLSPEQKSILDMRLSEDLSFKEISNRTGKTEVSLRKIYSRTVATLRGLVEGSKGRSS